ncbi:MFS transporter [Streptomyces sp. SP18BB07]|uniref:MFS transporter n=1 Tax=Streptomyces sp. SP18BB07 TaxID=3002522 RepID=UPI002E7A849C|nr:MFS transporter [Streptomyces sp. SP18BB07]MEE1758256.1 MFS transporter [Streptomyces sp. SP18BB07]
MTDRTGHGAPAGPGTRPVPPTPGTRPAPPPLTPTPTPTPRPVLVTLLLASTLTVMAGATISPALPAMRRHFAEVDDIAFLVRLLLTVPALAIALGAPLVGVLVDRVGRKPVLVASTLLYAMAGGSGLVLDDVHALLAGRVLLGLAVAGVMTSATALVADLYEGPERARALGLQAGAMGFGGVVFLSVGGVLAGLDWRGPFLLYLVSLPLAVAILLVVREPARPTAETTDLTSATSTTNAPGAPGAAVVVRDGLAGRARALTAGAVGILVLAFTGQLVFYTVPTQLPFHLAGLSGVGAVGSGLVIASMSAVQAVASTNYGRLAGRSGRAALTAIVFALLAGGTALLGLARGVPTVLAGLALIGTGVGLLVPHLNAWLVSRTPPPARGRMVSGITSALFLGQFLSPVAARPFADGDRLSGVYLAASALAAVMAAAAAAGWLRGRRHPAAAPEPGSR